MKGRQGTVVRPSNIFGGHSDDEDEEMQALPPHLRRLGKLPKPAKPNDEQQDDSIYQYDEVFDDMKEAEKIVKGQSQAHGRDANSNTKQSVYMSNLLDAKRRRDLDKLNLKASKTLRERELEGEEFKDKEVFETSSYKKFKDEAQKLQEDEEKRLASNKNNSGAASNISTYTKSIMDQEEMRHKAMIAATEGKLDEFKRKQQQQQQQQEEAHAPKATTPVLRGGLNLPTRPRPIMQSRQPPRPRLQKHYDISQLDKEKQTNAEKKLHLKLERLLRTKITDEYIKAARERYFERQKSKITKG